MDGPWILADELLERLWRQVVPLLSDAVSVSAIATCQSGDFEKTFLELIYVRIAPSLAQDLRDAGCPEPRVSDAVERVFTAACEYIARRRCAIASGAVSPSDTLTC